MSLISYELQQSPSSEAKTGDVNTRFEWSEGFKRIENATEASTGFYTKYVSNRKTALAKQQELEQETAFAKDIYNLYKKSITTQMRDSQRVDEQQQIYDRYPMMAMDKKNAISGYYGFKAPSNVAYMVAEKQKELVTQKTVDDTTRDIELGTAVLGPKAANMSPEEVAAVGKQTALDRIAFATTVDQMVQEDPSKANLKDKTEYLASTLLKATITDIGRDIENKVPINTEYVATKKAELVAGLQARGVPMKQAAETADYTLYDADRIAKITALSEQEKFAALERDNKMGLALFSRNFQNLTGVPFDSFQTLSRELANLDLKDQEKVLSLGNFVLQAGELTRAQMASLGKTFDYANVIGNNPNSSGLQVANSSAMLSKANIENNLKGLDGVNSKEKLNYFLSNSFENNKAVIRQKLMSVNKANEAFARMTPKEIAEYKRAEAADLMLMSTLAVGKIADEVGGIVEYSDGTFKLKEGETQNKRDLAILEDVNAFINDVKLYTELTEGRFGTFKDIDNVLKSESVEQALQFSNKLTLLDFINALLNPIKTVVSMSLGGTDQEFLWDTQRQGVRSSNLRRRTGVSSPIIDTLTSPMLDPFEFVPELAQATWTGTTTKGEQATYTPLRESLPEAGRMLKEDFKELVDKGNALDSYVGGKIKEGVKAIQEVPEKVSEALSELNEGSLMLGEKILESAEQATVLKDELVNTFNLLNEGALDAGDEVIKGTKGAITFLERTLEDIYDELEYTGGVINEYILDNSDRLEEATNNFLLNYGEGLRKIAEVGGRDQLNYVRYILGNAEAFLKEEAKTLQTKREIKKEQKQKAANNAFLNEEAFKKASERIKAFEGERMHFFRNVGDKKLTGGIGFNWTDAKESRDRKFRKEVNKIVPNLLNMSEEEVKRVKLSDEQIDKLFELSKIEAEKTAKNATKKVYDGLEEEQKAALIDLSFNADITKYRLMRTALDYGEKAIAAYEVMDSKAAKGESTKVKTKFTGNINRYVGIANDIALDKIFDKDGKLVAQGETRKTLEDYAKWKRGKDKVTPTMVADYITALRKARKEKQK